MSVQKFHKGDHVMIAEDLGPHMAHFQSDREAIVIGSYNDRFGGASEHNNHQYTLFIKGGGECSWYYEDQLTLIDIRRIDLLEIWKAEREAKKNQHSDLDWIFANGQDVIKNMDDDALGALGACMGISNMWGRSGEGFTLYLNTLGVARAAHQFLVDGDKTGWLQHCAKLNSKLKV